MKKLLRLAVFPLVCCMVLAGSTAVAMAQETTSSPDASASEGLGTDYPVAIHSGTCDSLTAQPAWDLHNATPIGNDDDDVEMVGTAANATVLQANETLDVKLDDLGNEPYAIAVHASPDDYDTIVACGEIAGPKVDGKVVIALVPVGDSRVSGIATLDSDTSGVLGLGDDQTKVTVYVVAAAVEAATPVA